MRSERPLNSERNSGSFQGDITRMERVQRVVPELEAHLVVALGGGAVRDEARPLACAISTCRLARSGRASDVPRRYRPSYTALARNAGNMYSRTNSSRRSST